jgi:hypothetical protein
MRCSVDELDHDQFWIRAEDLGTRWDEVCSVDGWFAGDMRCCGT